MSILSLILLPLMVIHSTSGQDNFWYMLCLLSNCFQTPPKPIRTQQQRYQQPVSTQKPPYQHTVSTQQPPDTTQSQATNTILPDTAQQQAIIAQAITNLQQQPSTIETQLQSNNLLKLPDTSQQQATNEPPTNTQVDNSLQAQPETTKAPQLNSSPPTPDITQQQTINTHVDKLLQTQTETTTAPPLDSLFRKQVDSLLQTPDTTNTQFDSLLQQPDILQQLNQKSDSTDINSVSNAGLIFTGNELIPPESNTGVIGSPALERPPATNGVDASKSLPVISSQTNNETPNQAQENNETSMQTSVDTTIQVKIGVPSGQPEISTPIQTNVMASDSVRTFSTQPQQPQYQEHSWMYDLNCYFVNGQCQESYQLCFGILKESFCAGATSSCCIPLNEFFPR